ncbi:MAG: hypothetical protein ACLVIG_07555, partial [Sutterella wadsworthensis]
KSYSLKRNRTRRSRKALVRSLLFGMALAVCHSGVAVSVKNRNSRQPLADEMTLEEVPKKKKARRLDWRRSGPNDAMLHEQAALPMVEGGAQLCRKEESRRSA